MVRESRSLQAQKVASEAERTVRLILTLIVFGVLTLGGTYVVSQFLIGEDAKIGITVLWVSAIAIMLYSLTR